MKVMILIMVAACLWAVAASGQIDPNSDGIGMFGGWECGLVVPDNVSIWGWNIITPGALALSDPPKVKALYR